MDLRYAGAKARALRQRLRDANVAMAYVGENFDYQIGISETLLNEVHDSHVHTVQFRDQIQQAASQIFPPPEPQANAEQDPGEVVVDQDPGEVVANPNQDPEVVVDQDPGEVVANANQEVVANVNVLQAEADDVLGGEVEGGEILHEAGAPNILGLDDLEEFDFDVVEDVTLNNALSVLHRLEEVLNDENVDSVLLDSLQRARDIMREALDSDDYKLMVVHTEAIENLLAQIRR